jgi:hypothetical protein
MVVGGNGRRSRTGQTRRTGRTRPSGASRTRWPQDQAVVREYSSEPLCAAPVGVRTGAAGAMSALRCLPWFARGILHPLVRTGAAEIQLGCVAPVDHVLESNEISLGAFRTPNLVWREMRVVEICRGANRHVWDGSRIRRPSTEKLSAGRQPWDMPKTVFRLTLAIDRRT